MKVLHNPVHFFNENGNVLNRRKSPRLLDEAQIAEFKRIWYPWVADRIPIRNWINNGSLVNIHPDFFSWMRNFFRLKFYRGTFHSYFVIQMS